VPLHRAGADVELRCDLRVGPPLGGEPGDVRLLGGEFEECVDASPAGGLARRRQLVTRLVGEPVGAHGDEHVVGGVQVGPGVDAAVLATQPLPVEQMGAGQLGTQLGAAEAVDRFAIQVLGGRPPDQRTAARFHTEAEVRPAGVGELGQAVDRVDGEQQWRSHL